MLAMLCLKLSEDGDPAFSVMLTAPPSTNNLFVSVNGKLGGVSRIKSQRYNNWLRTAGWEINLARKPAAPLAEPVRVEVEAGVDRRRDIDNVLKGLLDVLVKMRVIADDNLIDDLRIVRVQPATGMVRVSVWPM